jgi:signal transduction histidine kinase
MVRNSGKWLHFKSPARADTPVNTDSLQDVGKVKVYETALSVVFEELLMNAYRYCQYPNGYIGLETIGDEKDESVVVRIINDGQPIPKRVRGIVWGTSAESLSPADERTALGLFLARRVCACFNWLFPQPPSHPRGYTVMELRISRS